MEKKFETKIILYKLRAYSNILVIIFGSKKEYNFYVTICISNFNILFLDVSFIYC